MGILLQKEMKLLHRTLRAEAPQKKQVALTFKGN